jgi:Alpha/beta hydrolase of unknown function (DUF900)
MTKPYFLITDREITPQGFGNDRNAAGNTFWGSTEGSVEDFTSWKQILPGDFLTSANSYGLPLCLDAHGFNSDFKKAAGGFYREVCDGLSDVATHILYAWPSEGRVEDYFSDRARARQAAPDFLAAMRLLGPEACGIDHSMGNYLRALALEEGLAGKDPAVLVNKLVMVAPDVGNILGHEYKLAKQIKCFYTWDDVALQGSSILNPATGQGLPRLGLTGAIGQTPSNYSQVDCANELDFVWDPVNIHSIYFKSKRPLQAMAQFLGEL